MTVLQMENWRVETRSKPLLAFSGENNTEDVYIIPDAVEDYIYTFDVSNRGYKSVIPLDKTTYEEQDALHVLLTSGQIGMPGILKAQIVARKTEDTTIAVKKSNVFPCVIGESVNSESQYENMPDSAFEKYVTKVGEIAEQVQNNTGAAVTSKDNAKASEEAAKQSETNAKASEEAAKASEENAKKSEEASKASEEASALSENNAKASEEASAQSEVNAKASEESSLESQNAAAESEKNANDYSLKSQSYAVGGTGTRDGEDTDNSKYYSEQSKLSSEKAADSESESLKNKEASDQSAKNAAESETKAKASEEAAAESEKSAADHDESAGASEKNVTNIYTAISNWGLSVENGKLCVTYKTEE